MHVADSKRMKRLRGRHDFHDFTLYFWLAVDKVAKDFSANRASWQYKPMTFRHLEKTTLILRQLNPFICKSCGGIVS